MKTLMINVTLHIDLDSYNSKDDIYNMINSINEVLGNNFPMNQPTIFTGGLDNGDITVVDIDDVED